jgi:hypothetical protein
MKFILNFSPRAAKHFKELQENNGQKRIFKEVCKTLAYMETNLRHPSLNTHEFHGLKGCNDEKIYEAYAQQKTPGAYRIFWHYGPEKNVISIIGITPHP